MGVEKANESENANLMEIASIQMRTVFRRRELDIKGRELKPMAARLSAKNSPNLGDVDMSCVDEQNAFRTWIHFRVAEHKRGYEQVDGCRDI